MALCKICGEYITEDMKQCPKCATPISADYDYQATLSSIEDTYKKFEEDLKVAVDRSKLTYICSLCGGVNHIDKKRCFRCGKPRPRTEYIKALRTLKKKAAPQEDVFARLDELNKKAEEGELEREEVSPPPVASLAEQQAQLGTGSYSPAGQQTVLYRYETGPAQNRPVSQPFVIVPYVNPAQPLYQYDPEQVYKFEPYSYMENLAKAEEQKAYMQGPTPSPSDLAILRAKRLEEIDELTRKIKELATFRQEAVKARKRKKRSSR